MQTDKLDMEAFREDALAKLKAGEGLLGANGAFTPLLKAFLEEALEGEVEQHIAEGSEPNRKNGHGKKIVRTTLGEIEIATPRDRNSTFQPKLVPKRTKGLPKDIERQIMALYARGSSLGDIRDFLEEMYDVEVSPATLSRVTDKVIPLLEEWRTRPLETVYPFVFMDAIHYKVREEGRVISKAVYGIIGVNQEGYRDVLGLYVGENESAKFWMRVMADLQTRGVEDILIASVDNLAGFVEAIGAIFPTTDVQLCVVHQIRRLEEVLDLHGHQGVHGRPEDDLPGSHPRQSPARTGPPGAEVGPEVPEGHRVVAAELGQPHDDVQLHPDDPEGHVYHQCHRGLPPPAAARDQDEGLVLVGHGAHEVAVPGPARRDGQVAAPDAQLEPDPLRTRDHLRRAPQARPLNPVTHFMQHSPIADNIGLRAAPGD